MAYLGDFVNDYASLNCKFTTVDSTGAPASLTSGVISVYKNNSVTQSTAGITLTADFDGVTGLNNVLIDLSSDSFYDAGNDYQIVVTTGTVDGVSVVGYVVGEFSIQNRYMRGTDSAALASALSTAQTDLDTLTGSDGVTLATSQPNYAPATAAALSTHDGKLDVVDGIVDSILVDTAEIGVAGVGLTNLGGMSTTMKAQVNTEADTAISDAGLATASALATVDTVVDGIQTDLSNATDGLGALKILIDAIQTDLSNGTDGLGALKTLIDTVDTVVDGLATTLGVAGAGLTDLGGMSTTMKSQVNAEVVDTLATDTYAESSAVPSATASLKDKINWVATLARNKITQTATTASLRNDADDADIATSTDSDDGTTAIRGEWV